MPVEKTESTTEPVNKAISDEGYTEAEAGDILNRFKQNPNSSALEEKVRLLAYYPNQTIQNMAIKVMEEYGILGKPEKSTVMQLISGYKNPYQYKSKPVFSKDGVEWEAETGAFKPIQQYTEDDYKLLAVGLLSIEDLTFEQVLKDIISMLAKNKDNIGNQKIILNNARVLLKNLILVDNAMQNIPDLNHENFSFSDGGIMEVEPQKRKEEAEKIQQAYRELIEFIKDNELDQDNGFEEEMKEASEMVARNIELVKKQKEKLEGSSDSENIHKFISKELSGELDIKAINDKAQVLANDLKLIDFYYITNIRSVDLYNQAWSKKKTKMNANVNKAAAYFNKLSQQVEIDFLYAQTKRHKMNVVAFYFELIGELIKTHNLNAARSVLSGLAKANVLNIIKDVKELKEKYDIYSNYFSADNRVESKKVYSNHKKNDRNTVPFFGDLLSDITFAEDGNAAVYENSVNPGSDVSLYRLNMTDEAARRPLFELQENILYTVKNLPPTFSTNIYHILSSQEYSEKELNKKAESNRIRSPINLDKINNFDELKAALHFEKTGSEIPLFFKIQKRGKKVNGIDNRSENYSGNEMLYMILDKLIKFAEKEKLAKEVLQPFYNALIEWANKSNCDISDKSTQDNIVIRIRMIRLKLQKSGFIDPPQQATARQGSAGSSGLEAVGSENVGTTRTKNNPSREATTLEQPEDLLASISPSTPTQTTERRSEPEEKDKGERESNELEDLFSVGTSAPDPLEEQEQEQEQEQELFDSEIPIPRKDLGVSSEPTENDNKGRVRPATLSFSSPPQHPLAEAKGATLKEINNNIDKIGSDTLNGYSNSAYKLVKRTISGNENNPDKITLDYQKNNDQATTIQAYIHKKSEDTLHYSVNKSQFDGKDEVDQQDILRSICYTAIFSAESHMDFTVPNNPNVEAFLKAAINKLAESNLEKAKTLSVNNELVLKSPTAAPGR